MIPQPPIVIGVYKLLQALVHQHVWFATVERTGHLVLDGTKLRTFTFEEQAIEWARANQPATTRTMENGE